MTRLRSPYARRLGIIELAESGTGIILALPFNETLIGRRGFLHGGAIAGFLALACEEALVRLRRDNRADFGCVTSTVQFLRGAREQMDVCATADVSVGGALATANAMAWQADRAQPIATACIKYILA